MMHERCMILKDTGMYMDDIDLEELWDRFSDLVITKKVKSPFGFWELNVACDLYSEAAETILKIWHELGLIKGIPLSLNGAQVDMVYEIILTGQPT